MIKDFVEVINGTKKVTIETLVKIENSLNDAKELFTIWKKNYNHHSENQETTADNSKGSTSGYLIKCEDSPNKSAFIILIFICSVFILTYLFINF